jgi:septum formation protein
MVLSLLLASNSPRRRELLTEAGFDFEKVSPQIEEKSDVDLTVRELTLANAIRKGTWAARRHRNKVVLAADTLVALEGSIIGKPADLAEAGQILRRLSGRIHEVWSAVFICHPAAARSTTFHEISHVHFRSLDRSTIDNYLRKIDPLDKAGAYAAQGQGAEIIEHIDGSYTNVVGLPMEKTTAALAQFGIKPKSSNASRPVRPGE